jgi:hypothetical protein
MFGRPAAARHARWQAAARALLRFQISSEEAGEFALKAPMEWFDKPQGPSTPSSDSNRPDGSLSDVSVDGSTELFRVGVSGLRPASEHERAHYLLVIAGDTPSRRIRLGARPTVIGRAAPADLVLLDPQVSRSHCRVDITHDQAVVTDLGSTNGTYIDDERVSGSAALAAGARLQVGSHVLVHEWRIRKEVEESQALDQDIAKASRYIRSLLPPPLSEGPVRTEWLLLPCSRLGGDAFGYRFLDRNTFAVYLIDVSGHGAGAAMHAVTVMNVLRQNALPGTDFTKPAAVLSSLNAMFQMDEHGGMYSSLWYGVFHLGARKLSFCSAGHHPAYLVPPGRENAFPLKTNNLVVGATPDFSFAEGSADFDPGSSLYLFSDGVFEITTKAGAQWGVADVVPFLLEPALPGTAEPERLHAAVQRNSRSPVLEDDFSMVVVTLA